MLKLCKKNLLNNWVFLCVALYFLLLFTVPRGYGIGVVLLALTALIVIPLSLWKKQKINLSKVDRNLFIMFAIYGVGLTLINIWHNNPIKEYEHGFKFLLAIPMFLLLYKYPIKPIWLFILVMLATVIGAGLGYYNYTHYGWAYRATVVKMNTIAYSSIIQLFAFISIIGLILVKDIKNKLLKWAYAMLSVIAFVVGMYVSVLSLSRGVWLAIPFQILLVAFFYYKFYKKIVIVITLLFSLGLVSLYFTPQTHIKSRIDKTFKEITAYQKGGTATSIGSRLEMYKFSLLMTKENPILGTPRQEREEKLKQFGEKKIINSSIKRFKFLHSRYFEMLAQYGTVGIVLLLLLDLFVIIAFLFRFKSSNVVTKATGMVGILVLVSYQIYGLVDSLFFINVGLLAYFVLLGSFFGSAPLDTKDDRK